MKRKVIAVDFDDVLINNNLYMIVWHNAMYGTEHTFDEIRTFWFHTIWNCTYEESIERFAQYMSSSFQQDVAVMDGAREALRALKEKYDLIIVTGRPVSVEPFTHMIVERHFNGVFKEVIHMGKDPRTDSKAHIIESRDTSYFIDDAFHNCQDVAESGVHSLLFERPWNTPHVIPKNLSHLITPVSSWKEITEVLL